MRNAYKKKRRLNKNKQTRENVHTPDHPSTIPESAANQRRISLVWQLMIGRRAPCARTKRVLTTPHIASQRLKTAKNMVEYEQSLWLIASGRPWDTVERRTNKRKPARELPEMRLWFSPESRSNRKWITPYYAKCKLLFIEVWQKHETRYATYSQINTIGRFTLGDKGVKRSRCSTDSCPNRSGNLKDSTVNREHFLIESLRKF